MMVHEAMIRFSPVLLVFVSGCAGCGTASRLESVPDEMKVYRPSVPPLADRHSSSRLAGIAPGTWLRYRFASNGSETLVTFGVVKAEADALWVEVVEEGDPKKASLRRITFDGDVTSARVREFPSSGPPSELADQPISPYPDLGNQNGPPARVDKKETQLKVGTREITATVLRMLYRDEAVGREREDEAAWSTAVATLLEDSEWGGLVYRKTPSESVTLVDWGDGYKPLIQ